MGNRCPWCTRPGTTGLGLAEVEKTPRHDGQDWKSSGRAGTEGGIARRAGARSGRGDGRHRRADGAPRDMTMHNHVSRVLGLQRGGWEKGEASNPSGSIMNSKSTRGQN